MIIMWYPLVNLYSLRTGKSPFFMGKSTLSMAIFNSKLFVYQRLNPRINLQGWRVSLPISGESLGMLHGRRRINAGHRKGGNKRY